MRVRLQLLLPLAVSVIISAGFLAAALTVGDTVRMAQPGYRAEAATRLVVLWGIAAVLVGTAIAVVIARLIVGPLNRMREAAHLLAERRWEPHERSPLTEIQEVLRGFSRAAGELRDRHGTELRERTELSALVDAVSEGILQLDSRARVVRVNRAGRELLGLPTDAPGRPVGSLVRSTELRRILERPQGSNGASAVEVVVDDRRVLVSSIALEEGGTVVTFVDLTDLRRLEEIRRDFVANASHELKTPLTSIRGYTETLLGGDLPAPEQRQFLATISRNAERLQRIVDDLLDLSRLESGRWQPELARIPVAEVAESAWQAFAEGARSRGVTWQLDADPHARASADRGALDQVFSNLYDNALRYTPGDGRIRVRIRTDDGGAARAVNGARREQEPPRDGPWVVVEVSDTGSGIPRDALPRIFERFYRVDPARSRAEGGTGLGLSIVKHMIESMGGAVGAESELGKGTTIRIWLPRAP